MIFKKLLLLINNNKEDVKVYKQVYLNLLRVKNQHPNIFHTVENEFLIKILLCLFQYNYPIDGFLRSIANGQLRIKYNKTLKEAVKLNHLANDEFLIHHLRNILNTNLALEQFLKKVRYELLKHYQQHQNYEENLRSLSLSLAIQNFYNEYIWVNSAEEDEKIEQIKKRLKTKDFNLNDLISYAMYAPLFKLKEIDLTETKIPDDCQQAFHTIYFNYLEEQALKQNIKTIGKIQDAVSLSVQKQYEEHPYPRWIHLKTNRPPIHKVLQRKRPDFSFPFKVNENNLQVLIAGCGTGQHPLSLAINNPHYQITAIDLSKASLAYAKRKAVELGITNIQFLQLDIINLHLLNKQFHHIESAGVIHHMKDQDQAWKILHSVLKKGGTMLIGVYSKIARLNVIKKRAEISINKINSDDASIKAYRQKMIEKEDIIFPNGVDFYATKYVARFIVS